jgi:hypothetical protein
VLRLRTGVPPALWLDRAMTATSGLRTAGEIHGYLTDQLNSALRRSGMYGGESAVRMLFDHLNYVEAQDTAAWARQQLAWEARGAWSSTGVAGAVRRYLPGQVESAMASIYAEAAHARGWLVADRPLSAGEYQAVHSTYRAWASRDRTHQDVLDAFGPPSILVGGSNPRYSKTLGYFSTRLTDPIIWFHLWNGTDPGIEPTWPPVYDQPVLLAAREGGGPLPQAMVFTPEGERRQPKGS